MLKIKIGDIVKHKDVFNKVSTGKVINVSNDCLGDIITIKTDDKTIECRNNSIIDCGRV